MTVKARLTLRQREVLDLMFLGSTDKQIAAELGIATRTVQFHTGALRRAFCVTTRTAVVNLALKQGILGVPV